MNRPMTVKSIATIQLVATIATVLGLVISFTVMATPVKVSIQSKRSLIHRDLQYTNARLHAQISMNVLRALTIALRSVRTLMGVMPAPVLLDIF